MIDPKEYFKGKRVLVVVAHHDDEVYVFGALICAIKDVVASMRIVCMSDMRKEQFEAFCKSVGAQYQTYPIKKCHRSEQFFVSDIIEITNYLIDEDNEYYPDIIVTHASLIDGQHIHPYHIIVNLAVKYAYFGLDFHSIVIRTENEGQIKADMTDEAKGYYKFYNESDKWQKVIDEPLYFDILEPNENT